MSATRPLEAVNLRELVAQHQREVWRYLRALGSQPFEADDLTQETFLVLVEKRYEARTEAATRRYLRSVARFLFLEQRRRDRRAPTGPDPEELELVWEAVVGDDGGEELIATLRLCLAELDDRSRAVVEARARGESRGQLAHRNHLSIEGVKSLLRRTMARLRACVERKRTQ